MSSLATASTYPMEDMENNHYSKHNFISPNERYVGISLSFERQDATCANERNGSIKATATGGTAPYSYLWSNGSNSSTIENLDIGNYTVTVTDANGLTKTKGAKISEPEQLVLRSSVRHVSCDATSDGRMDIRPEGGVGPYTYVWEMGGGGTVRTDLAPGLYSVTVTDANGCSAMVCPEIIGSKAPSVYTRSEPENCNGLGGDGKIFIEVEGDSYPFDIKWSTGDRQKEVLSSLSPGDYTVTVTNSRGCSTVETITVNSGGAIIEVQVNADEYICGDTPTGSASLSVTGGIAPYSYTWSNGATGASQNNLYPGTHTVTVTDANGCSKESSFTIDRKEVPNINLHSVRKVCFGESNGSIQTTTTGGFPPYTYAWSDGSTNATLSNAPEGVYTVTVTDANGCTNIGESKVRSTQAITITGQVTAVTCSGGNDGRIDVQVEGGTENGFTYSWNTGHTGTTIGNITAGTYTFSANDAFNNCTTTQTFVVTEPSPIVVTTSTISASNENASDGRVATTVSGGTPGYTYSWSNGATTADINDLAAGTYTLTVTDAVGCTHIVSVTIDAECIMKVKLFPAMSGCLGNEGNIVAEASGTSHAVTYTWSNGGTGRSIIGLDMGYYSVIATDAVGCTASMGVMIGNDCTCEDPVIKDIVVIKTSSMDSKDGAIQLELETTGPYKYTWSDPSISGTGGTGLMAGSYTVTITDPANSSCSTEETIIIGTAQLDPITITAITGSECGKSTGSAILSPANYSYSWSDGGSGHNRDGLAAGAYMVTATDPAIPGSQDIIEVVIEVEGGLALNSVINVFPQCGANNGAASIIATGGSGDYSYSLWGTTNTRTDLIPGTYTVEVRDNVFGCVERITFSLPSSGQTAEVQVTGTQAVSCAGDSDGEVQFTISDNTLPTRIVDGLGNIYAPNALPAGNYCVEVMDATGCLQASDCFEITEPDFLLVEISRIAPTCSTLGAINLAVQGGNGVYQVSWADLATASTNLNRDNLPAGAYSFTVSDAKNCSAAASNIQINQTAGPNISLSSTPATTNSSTDGSASVNVSGGQSPYTYQWNTGATTPSINNIPVGTYTVTVTDANGCAEVGTVTISATCELQASITKNANESCVGKDGSISAIITNANGNINYLWSNGQSGQTIAGLSEGYYTVTATDAMGCTASMGIMVGNDCVCTGPVIGNIIVIKASSMDSKDGSIQLNISSSGTYNYTWSDPALSGTGGTGLMAGSYDVTITDAANVNCSVETNIFLGSAQLDPIKITEITGSECGKSTGSAILSPANYSYSWSDGGSGHNRDGIAAGTYMVTATDPAIPSSQDIIQVVIEVEGGLAINAIINTLPDCGKNNGTVSITATGGSGNYSYGLWGASNTRTDLVAGTYTIEVRDNVFGCVEQLTFSLINSGPSLEVQVTGTQGVSCAGAADGQVQFTTSNNVFQTRIVDSFGKEYLSNALPVGNYCVEAIDADGCIQGSDCFEITSPDLLLVEVERVAATCSVLGAINLSVQGGNGGYQVSWADLATATTNLTRANLPAGTYSFTVSDSRNCSATAANIAISQTDGPSLSLSSSPAMTTSSMDGSASVSVSGGQLPYTYAWNNGGANSSINNVSAGTYTVTVTDANGCAEVGTVIIEATCVLQASLTTVNVSCIGRDGSLSAVITNSNGNLTYQWSNGQSSQTITGLSMGFYSVTATDEAGCTINTGGFVGNNCNCVHPEIISTVLIEATGPEEADGGISLTLKEGNDLFNFQWSTGQNGATINGLNPGIYTVTITDKNDLDCKLIREILVGNSTTKIGPIEVTASSNSECGQNNGSAQLFPTGLTYNWSDGGTGHSRSDLAPGIYTVTATFSQFPGETDIKIITITSEGGLVASATINQRPDCGVNNGAVTISATGGSGDYNYDWGSSTGANRNDLIAGAYSVTVTDEFYGCEDVIKFVLTDNLPQLTVDITGTTPVSCPRESDGSVQYTINNSGPVTETITDGQGNIYSPTALPAGEYCLEVRNTDNCLIAGDCFEITEPDEIYLEISRIPATCSTNGVIIAKASGGNDDFVFDWLDVPGTDDGPTRGNLEAGTYAVLATDRKGCTAYVNDIPIAAPKEPQAQLTTSSAATFTSNDGSISVITEGGLEPFRYLWSDGNGNSPNNTNLAPGPYSVTVVDANGCVTILETEVIVHCTFITANSNSNNVGCVGGNGSINLNITGGTGTISYAWDNGATTASLNNLSPGTYKVTVVDQGTCRYEDSFDIVEDCDCSAILNPSAAVNQLAECNAADGSATITVPNPGPNISYNWGVGIGTGSTRNDLAAGTYTVTVTDNISGCQQEVQVTIDNQPASAKIILNPLTVCFNQTGPLVFNTETSGCFTGPMDIAIIDAAGNSYDFNDLAAGDYIFILKDGNGVEIEREAFTVESLPEIGIRFDISPASCSGLGAIEVDIEGGNDQFTFNWEDVEGAINTPDREGLTAGLYELFLTDKTTGCISQSSYTVSAEGLDLSTIDMVYTCDKDQVQLSVINNKPEDELVYEWSPSTGIVSGATTGTPTVSIEGEQVYSYTVNNQFGCEQSGTVTVISAATRPPGTIEQSLQCDGRTVDFRSSGGAAGHYVWDFGDGTTSTENNPSHEYADAGDYKVTLQLDPNFPCAEMIGVMAERDISVVADAITKASFEVDYDPCTDEGLVTFINTSEVVPGVPNYLWDFGNGMTSTEESPQIKLDENANLNVTLTVSTTSGCESMFSVQEPFEVLRFPTVLDTVEACPNIATPINPNGDPAVKYNWTPANLFDDSNSPSPNIMVDRTTLVDVVISKDMCETKSSVLVVVPEEVEYDKPDDMAVCADEEMSIFVDIQAAGTLIWSTSPDYDPVLTTEPEFQAGPGEYYFQFTDTNGCTYEDAVIIENAAIDADIIAEDPIPLCLGDGTMLSVRNNNPNFEFISYDWQAADGITSTDLTDPRIEVNPTLSTEYSVALMNIAGCEDTIFQTVEVVDLDTEVLLDASRDTIFISETSELSVTPDIGLTITWSDDPNAGPVRTVMPMEDTTYEVTITDDNGCSSTQTVTVFVLNPVCGPPNIFFPNAFSPNGDGINDFLRVRGNGMQEVLWVVYNRWGEEVFVSNAEDQVWDGTFNNKLVDPDVYGYYLRVVCFSGDIYETQGNVTVLR